MSLDMLSRESGKPQMLLISVHVSTLHVKGPKDHMWEGSPQGVEGAHRSECIDLGYNLVDKQLGLSIFGHKRSIVRLELCALILQLLVLGLAGWEDPSSCSSVIVDCTHQSLGQAELACNCGIREHDCLLV